MRYFLYILVFLSAACGGGRVVVSRPAIPVDASVRLAADVVLPADRPAAGVPTVLIQTRYWRSFRMRGGGGPKVPQGPREGIVSRLVDAGFAVVIVDVRGTGASDGVWRWPWSDDEVRDMRAVLDWIVAQPWSNGAVGATGVSYEGTTALLAASVQHPALKAVLARQLEWELVDETIAPGGVRNALFADTWSDAVDALDHGRYPSIFPGYARWFVTGVARRDDDPQGTAQKTREAARPASTVAARARGVARGTDRFGDDAPPADSLGPAGHAPALAQTRAQVAIWGSWWDGATADAVFRADSTMPLVQAVIGPWNHEGDENASPLQRKTSVSPTVNLDTVVAFFTRTVRATPLQVDSARRVRWYVAGAEQWREAARWPLTTMRAWSIASMASTDDTMHTWRTTVPATTGENNRWTSGLARSVDVQDREKSKGLRSYTLDVLNAPLHVFGAGAVTCAVYPDAPEATLHVYVESVDPSGHVRLLTEGMQRVRASARTAPDTATTHIRLRPVAFALPAGWKLRFSLASDDMPTFERVPATAPVAWRLNPRACRLMLPEQRTP